MPIGIGIGLPVAIFPPVTAGTSLLNDLVAFWKLDEASGNRLDSAGANNLADNNTVTQATGKQGNAAQFTAANSEYLSIADNAALSMGDIDFTIAGWVYLDTKIADRGICAKFGGSQNEFILRFQFAVLQFVFSVYSGGSIVACPATSFGNPLTGQWYFVVAWHDSVANTINIQINNGAVDSVAYSVGVNDSNGAFRVGDIATLDRYMDGRIDELGVWKRVLTANERTTLYQAGSGLTYPFAVPAPAALVVSSPTAYRVFQRSGATGAIAITGTVNSGVHDVEARFNGGSYTTIATSATGAFSGSLTAQAQGQGTLDVRFVDAPGTIISVPYVGIGDVFIIAGQSNAVGQGTNNQVYSHATLKAGIFRNDYQWYELSDPTDANAGQVDTVSKDTTTLGSYWPLIATSYMADRSLPIAFVPCAMGGTVLLAWQPGANHQDRTTLYGSMIYRALQTGCKAVLWHQGETDAINGNTQATYNSQLDTLANAINTDLGVKLMPCKFQRCSGITDANENTINAAIAEAWGDNANVLTGPDLTGLNSNDSLHLQSDVNLSAAAALWWTAIETAFGW